MFPENTVKNYINDNQNSENIVNDNNISISQKRQNSLNNLKPFKPYSELTPEEQQKQRELLSKGGKARTDKQTEKHERIRTSAFIRQSQQRYSKEVAR